MTEFLHLVNVEEAKRRLFDALSAVEPPRRVEWVDVETALNRILAEDILSPEMLPPFARSTVDGFAVRAEDTFGASASLPAYLSVVGEVPMGAVPDFALAAGKAAVVHTGGMMPDQADAVVMVEDTQPSAEHEIEVHRAVAGAENVLRAGEDLGVGQLAIEKGSRLRAQELGGLSALGIRQVKVVTKPKVALIATGDEVVMPSAKLRPGEIRDVNTTTLSALVASAGGVPQPRGIVPDIQTALFEETQLALEEADAVVITAGSSVSERDRTVDVLAGLGAPGILVHGVSVRPGKPTIIAVSNGKLAIGLPGNPVSALVVAGIFLVPALRYLLGERGPDLHPVVQARLAVNVSSRAGREDFLPVRLEASEGDWWAYPVYGRSNLIFTLVRADGLARIAAESNGLPHGATVSVELFY